MRISECVGPSHRRDVAARIKGAPHQDNSFDSAGERWIKSQRQRNVGQAPDRNERQFTGVEAALGDDELRRGNRGQHGSGRFAHGDIAETIAPVDVGHRRNRRRYERHACTLRNGNPQATSLEEKQCVARAVIDAGVAEDRRHAEQLDLRRLRSKENRHRVIDADIDVENDLLTGILRHRLAERRGNE